MYNKYHLYFYSNTDFNQYYYSLYDSFNHLCIFDKITDFLDIYNYIYDNKLLFKDIALIFDNLFTYENFNYYYRHLFNNYHN